MSSAVDSSQDSNSNDTLSKSNFRIRWRFVLVGLCLLAFGIALPFALGLYYSSSYSQKTDEKNVNINPQTSPETSPLSFERQKTQDETVNSFYTGDFAFLPEIDGKRFSPEKTNHTVSANTVSFLKFSTAPQPQRTPNKAQRLPTPTPPPPIRIIRRTIQNSCPQGQTYKNSKCNDNMTAIFVNGNYYKYSYRCGDVKPIRSNLIWDLKECGIGTHSIYFNGQEQRIAVNPCECVPDSNTATNNPNVNTNVVVNNDSPNTNQVANNTNPNINQIANNANTDTNSPAANASPTATVSVNGNALNKPSSSGDKFGYAYPSRFIKGEIYQVCLSLQPNERDVNLCENPVVNISRTNGTRSAIKREDADAFVTGYLKPGNGLEIVGKPEQMPLPYDRNAGEKDLPRWIWQVRLSESGENLDEVELNFECDITSGRQKSGWKSEKLESGVGLPVLANIVSYFSTFGGGLALILGFIPLRLKRGKIWDKVILSKHKKIWDEKALEEIVLSTKKLESLEDEVHCTLFAPDTARAASSFLVQVFAHLDEQTAELEEIAAESDEEAKRQTIEKLSRKIKRGTDLIFELRMPQLEIDEPVQSHRWEGEILEIPFIVSVPENHPPGSRFGKIIVSENGVPVGRLTFKIKITSADSAAKPENVVAETLNRYKYAFISYASEDRPKVLPRVQMLDAAKIEYFQDILSLDPGDRWARELYKHIDKSDVLFLFWSDAASRSEWIEKEVLYALERHGADENAPPDIIPIIIEGPPPAKPSDKLNFLHFNDKFIYFIYAAEAESEIRKADKT